MRSSWPGKGGTTRPEIEVFDDVASLARRFTAVVSGARSLALSRPTPTDVFERVRLPEGAEVFQVDERNAPASSDDRNATLIDRYLAPDAFHPMSVDADLAAGAVTYGELLVAMLGSPPVFDVVHLGLGPDGHTASLIPGDPVLDVDDRWVAATRPTAGFERLTLTYPAIDASRLVVFVVAGAAKAEVVARVVSGDRSQPAARIENPNVLILLDTPAASRLSGA